MSPSDYLNAIAARLDGASWDLGGLVASVADLRTDLGRLGERLDAIERAIAYLAAKARPKEN